jgi:hypothetical protein
MVLSLTAHFQGRILISYLLKERYYLARLDYLWGNIGALGSGIDVDLKFFAGADERMDWPVILMLISSKSVNPCASWLSMGNIGALEWNRP